MIRGGSIGFRFALPCQCQDLKSIKFICGQTNNGGPSADRPLPIVKALYQCQMVENPPCLIVRLNQEETLRFSDKLKAYVQLRAETNDGSPIVCRKHYINVYPVEDDSILDEDVILPTPTPGQEWVRLDGAPIIAAGQSGEECVYFNDTIIG